MTDYVKVPYVELLQRAARIRQEAETIKAEMRTLRDTIEGLEWMGKRADRFFSLWNETLPEMEQWVMILETFATELEEQARRMQAADEAF
ncbi:MAG: WXG100 family type VII secretion target [Chloroflexota bacterium]